MVSFVRAPRVLEKPTEVHLTPSQRATVHMAASLLLDYPAEGTLETRLSAVEAAACPTCGSCAGMFTANSMNCLTEALGLALPGNGTTLATHADRGELFKRVGHQIVEITRAYYEHDDDSVLPRSIATKAAFENAMSLDIAMGGSTNTILHLLAKIGRAHV